MSNELLNVTCKQGRLQVTQDGQLRVQGLLKNTVWQVPCAEVTKFTTQPGVMLSVNVIVHTVNQGRLVVDMVTRQNFAKLEALFPNISTKAVTGKAWYDDPLVLTHIEEYKDMKKMRRDVEAAAQNGWMPQNTDVERQGFSAGKALVGDVLFGPVGMLAGAMGNNKKKATTITFVRTPEWNAKNL